MNGKNTSIVAAGALGGPGAALFVKWAWDSAMPGNPMPHEVALFVASIVALLAGTFLPQAFGDNS